MMFYEKMLKSADKSRLVFRLDISLPIAYTEDQDSLTELAYQLCGEVKDYVAAISIDSPFFLAVGPVNAEKISRKFNVPFIADFNLAETPEASLWIAEHAFNAGFDALIAHSFMGSSYLAELKHFAGSKAIIPIVGMTHSSSREFINPNTEKFCQNVKELGLKAVVGPSSVKGIREIRKLLPGTLIFADSEAKTAGHYIKAGADFEMVGRTIHISKDPEETTIQLMEALKDSSK